MVGVDFSAAGEHALVAAIRAAKAQGVAVTLVHAISPLGAPGLAPARPRPDPAKNESADLSASLVSEGSVRSRRRGAKSAHAANAGSPNALSRPGARTGMARGPARARPSLNPGSLWRARAKAAGVATEWVSRAGNPVHVLVDEAQRRGARCIVVGHAPHMLEPFIGSMSERLVERSPIPVLVVPLPKTG